MLAKAPEFTGVVTVLQLELEDALSRWSYRAPAPGPVLSASPALLGKRWAHGFLSLLQQ